SADLDFVEAMKKVPLRIHAGLHNDETAMHSHWHLPLAHMLESWSDGRAADGSTVIMQPLVRPWLDVRSRHQLLSLFSGEVKPQKEREILRATWAEEWQTESAAFEERWQAALVSGRLPDDNSGNVDPGTAIMPTELPVQNPSEELEIILHADPAVHD